MILKKMQDINISPEELYASVGDIIEFTLEDGEMVQAMAMKEEGVCMIYALVDCLEEEHSMKGIKEFLNEVVFHRFPEEIRNKMAPFIDGSMLRLMTQKEVFGENYWCDDEPEDVEQFEPMKERRNRVANRGYKGCAEEYEWYWLSNELRDVVSGATFANVSSRGNANNRRRVEH